MTLRSDGRHVYLERVTGEGEKTMEIPAGMTIEEFENKAIADGLVRRATERRGPGVPAARARQLLADLETRYEAANGADPAIAVQLLDQLKREITQ